MKYPNLNLNFVKTKNCHYLFLFIISLNYFIPLILFGEITLFYVDTLDHEIVYNNALGKYYSGDESFLNNFLNGKLKIEFIRRLFQPFTLFYYFFSAELAYWIIDILVKIVSYFSFFILAKKITKNIFLCSLVSAIYSCLNLASIEGFYFAIFPYLIYLIFFKKKIQLKHYLVAFLFGINSDFLRAVYFLPFIFLLSFVFNDKNTIFKKNVFFLSFIFLTAIFISNIGTFYAVLFHGPFHRSEWFFVPLSFIETVWSFLKSIFGIPTSLDYKFALIIPKTILVLPLLLLSFFSKNKKVLRILLLLFFVKLFASFLNFQPIADLRNNLELFKIYSWQYIDVYDIFLYSILLIYYFRFNFNKIILTSALTALFLFQINSSIGPLYKKYILKSEEPFRNFYTFSGYYLPDEYKKIKQIVKDKAVISIGLDPSAAHMANITTIDGYFNMYPLDYKHSFRKVIIDQLNTNIVFKNYYDNWGSRLYTFVENPQNILVNFNEAKKLGATYVISKYIIKSPELTIVCENCTRSNISLYQIK